MSKGTPLNTFKERNLVVLILLILLGGFILFSLRGIFGAVLGTVVMYTIFRPLNLYLIKTRKWRKQGSAIFILFASFCLIILPFLGVGYMIISKLITLQKNPKWIQETIQKVNEFAGDKLHQPDLVENSLRNVLTYAASFFTSIIGGAAEILISIGVMYFLLYFLLAEYKKFESGLLRFAPFREENALRFGRELRNITYSNVLGQGCIAIIQGALVCLGYWIFGFSDPIFWGIVCIILSFIPVLGAPLVFVPACLIVISQGDSYGGIGMLIYGFLIVTNIDNVLRLVIAKRVGDIHPIITIVGVIIGIPVFGIMGLVYGPLLLSYFIITVKIYETNRMAEMRLAKIEEENTKFKPKEKVRREEKS